MDNAYKIAAILLVIVLSMIAADVRSGRASNDKGPKNDYDILRPIISNPDELGYVNWLRDYREAAKDAREQDKLILILFQEVPGCNTASGYGINVLRHPLIVEAIETLFVPLAVYNNESGDDAEALRSFGEPAWNNPVVRIVDADKAGYAPRLSGDYTQAGLVNNMIQALEKKNEDVPLYLRLLAAELDAVRSGTDTAVIAMSCFWSGEGSLGAKKGVVSTRPGFMGGMEVVEVEYDPNVLTYGDLIMSARADRVADTVFTNDGHESEIAAGILGDQSVKPISAFRPDRTPKYYLSNSLYRHVPMTKTQASRVNAFLSRRVLPDSVLSPRQLDILTMVKSSPDADWPDEATNAQDITTAWRRVISVYDLKIGKAD